MPMEYVGAGYCRHPWPGGRIFTTRDFFADGIGVERGGEFISTEHTAVRNLARRFNLPLEEVASLPAGSIRTEQALEAVHGDLLGPFRLHFSDGSVTVCDRLVLAIPFSTLRDVALAPHILAAMRPVKRWAIQTQEMGSNAKLHIQCQGRPWSDMLLIDGEPSQGNGAAYSGADGFGTVWDAAVNHPGPRAVLCDYLGGEQGRNLRGPAFGEAHRDDVRRLLAQMELVFPGTEAAYTGHALVSSWIDYPWSQGSYSSPTLGHYTGFFGAAGLPEGNIHFAGEHTDVEFFGFLEGAVESGQRVAREIHTG